LVIRDFLLLAASVAATTAEEAASYVGVTSISLEPEVFMQDDSGTIVVEIKNSGSNPVSIARAEILSNEIQVLNYQTYDKVGAIGPSNTMKFTFHVQAKVDEGVYFPMFYLDFTNAGSLRYPIAMKVESTPVSISVVDAPASFHPSQECRHDIREQPSPEHRHRCDRDTGGERYPDDPRERLHRDTGA